MKFGPVPVEQGAPGCTRSPKPNVIDRVLPALLAGDIQRLGYGGLLAEEAPRAPRAPAGRAVGAR